MRTGDYIRTKNKVPFEPSQIAKIIDMKKDEGYKNQYYITLDHNLPTTYNFHIYSEDVIKSSPNKIDLIEENDIVNHSRVVCIGISTDLSGTHKYLVLENRSNCANGNIKSIVTKEQFEQMEYKIGGSDV